MIKKSTEAAFWTSVNEAPAQYPWLAQDITCEIAIIGGGMTAALCAMPEAERAAFVRGLHLFCRLLEEGFRENGAI